MVVDWVFFQQRKGSFIPSILRAGAGPSELPSPSLASSLAGKGSGTPDFCTAPNIRVNS